MNKPSWLTLVALGLTVRLAFSFWTGNPNDFEVFIRVGHFVAGGSSPTMSQYPYVQGLGQPTYQYVSGLGYPPAWGLYLASAFRIYQTFPISPYFYYFLIKLLPILGDLALAYVILLLVKNSGVAKDKAEKVSALFFLCPFVIFISSVWGMFDSIPILFTMLSLLLMLFDKPRWSALSLGLGVYFKVIPIIYLPIQLLFIRKKRDLKEAMLYMLITLAVPFVLTLLPLTICRWGMSESGLTVLSQTQKSGDVLTFWNISALLKDAFPSIFSQELLDSFFAFPPIRYLWLLGLMISYVVFARLQRRSVLAESDPFKGLETLLVGFSCTTIAFLLTRTFIPEQFVLYLLVTVVMLQIISIRKYYKYVWIAAFAFALVNMYPFAFAYLQNLDFWSAFAYLSGAKPFSTVRYAARFALAIVFDFLLLRLFSKIAVEK